MKKGLILLFAILLCSVTSCDEKFGYKFLDGMWQMQSVTYLDDETTVHPEDMYFSFQMNIIEVKKLGTALFNGTFDYTDGVISSSLRVGEPDLGLLPDFGMNAPEQHFKVVKLNSDKLILQSDYARLELRKY